MEKIDVFTRYRADRRLYCGRVDVKMMFFVALVLMAVTQLFITIWYLTYHVWYWFIVLACILAVSAVIFFAIRTQNPLFLLIVMVYQILFVLLCIGASINLIVLLCHPHSNSYIFRDCAKNTKNTYEDCTKQVRITTGVYFPVYFAFGLVNLWCLSVVWAFYRSLSSSPLPSYNPRAAAEVHNTNTFANNASFGLPKPQEERPVPPPAGGRTEFSPHPTERVEPDWGAPNSSPQGNYNPDYLNYRQEELHVPAFPPPQQNSANNHLYDTTPSW